MSREEAVDLYLQGRIDRRMFVRALVAAGVTVASATTYAKVLAPERAGAASPPRPLGVLYSPDSLNFVSTWGSMGTGKKQFTYPHGVAVDPERGSVYVTDQSHRVRKFDKNGKFLRRWGGFGTGNGQFMYPVGVAVDPRNGDVVVNDSGNDRIQKFDRKGNFLRRWGSSGIGPSEFDNPAGVAVDGSGRIYVTDQNNDRVQKFKPNGEYLTEWGGGSGGFDIPNGIAVTAGGKILVCDTGHSRIQRFDNAGGFEFTTGYASGSGPFDHPAGICANTQTGDVYVADTNAFRIKKLDSELNFLDRIEGYGSDPGQFFNPFSIAFRNNRIYVADTGNNRIQKLTA